MDSGVVVFSVETVIVALLEALFARDLVHLDSLSYWNVT